MLYCPGKGQELLSALGVNLECHASSSASETKGCRHMIRFSVVFPLPCLV